MAPPDDAAAPTPSPLHVEQQPGERPVLLLEIGDRIRLTRPLIQTVLRAVQGNQDHLVLASLQRDPATRLVTMTVRLDDA